VSTSAQPQTPPPPQPAAPPAQRPAGPAARAPVAASNATVKARHYGLFAGFVAMVVVPTVLALSYLYLVATDQYTSTVGFSVRSEEMSSAVGLLSGLSSLSGTSSSDTDILYEFIQSQELVSRIDAAIGLRALYTKPAFDPVFALSAESSIEDLVSYWRRMVRIYYDSSTRLIELRVHAFEPRDAQLIAEKIFEESTIMINKLSAIARDDATRYAKEELDRSVERLKEARQAVTEFRSRTQIVDPTADIQGQMGLLNTLQQQLASAFIELNLLRQTARQGDPRIEQAERRIAVIQQLISEEREKFGVGGDGVGETEAYSTLVGEFERLIVDREFAEKAYLTALAAYDTALAEAQRQSRYLAAYVAPTLAEDAQHPRRLMLTGLIAFFAVLAWSITALIYYSVRDRR
jgi:capsular polysaccharide transport system permease protein